MTGDPRKKVPAARTTGILKRNTLADSEQCPNAEYSQAIASAGRGICHTIERWVATQRIHAVGHSNSPDLRPITSARNDTSPELKKFGSALRDGGQNGG